MLFFLGPLKSVLKGTNCILFSVSFSEQYLMQYDEFDKFVGISYSF